MAWLTDLLKYFSISKSFTAAVFVTSLVLLVGPTVSPLPFDVPAQWRWAVMAACVFSFVLLVIWAVPPVVKSVIAVLSRLRNNPTFNPPTGQEKDLIAFLGQWYPNKFCNLDRIDQSKISKLKLLQLCASLERKGLVRINKYDNNSVILTEKGRDYAAKLARQQSKA